MKAIKGCKANDFIYVLSLLSYDEQLFRKEFVKTLNWLPKPEHIEIMNWFIQNGYNKKYPDLAGLINKA